MQSKIFDMQFDNKLYDLMYIVPLKEILVLSKADKHKSRIKISTLQYHRYNIYTHPPLTKGLVGWVGATTKVLKYYYSSSILSMGVYLFVLSNMQDAKKVSFTVCHLGKL